MRRSTIHLAAGRWSGSPWHISRPLALAAALLLVAGGPPASAAALRVNGSTTVNPVVAEAAEILRAEEGLAITVDVQGGSSGGISGVADGSVEVGTSSREISGVDRRKFPGVDFVTTRIGLDAVALVVSRDVWEGGVRALSRDQVRAIYEGRVRSWRALGGPDRRVVMFDKEPGRGTWEVFADWAYGGAGKAPAVSHRQVGGNEEARTKAATTPGAMTQLSSAWAEQSQGVFALVVRGEDGRLVEATPETIASGEYPLVRPLLLVTDGPPRGAARRLVELLLSPRGQALVVRHGYLPVGDTTDEELRGRAGDP